MKFGEINPLSETKSTGEAHRCSDCSCSLWKDQVVLSDSGGSTLKKLLCFLLIQPELLGQPAVQTVVPCSIAGLFASLLPQFVARGWQRLTSWKHNFSQLLIFDASVQLVLVAGRPSVLASNCNHKYLF